MNEKIISVIKYYPNYLDILEEFKQKKIELSQKFSDDMIMVLSIESVNAKNCLEMVEHAKRLSKLTESVIYEFQLTKGQIQQLKLLARFHDIGKICVPSHILTKVEPLEKEDWDIIKTHPIESFLILNNIEELKPIAYDAMCHHENYDGTGYPNGLKGAEIPLFSRIIRVLDAYEVLVSGRVYKEPVSQQEALNELNACKNKQFDPEVVDCVIKAFSKEKNL